MMKASNVTVVGISEGAEFAVLQVTDGASAKVTVILSAEQIDTLMLSLIEVRDALVQEKSKACDQDETLR
jgi:hypothetical protein